jgi:hypothetical protein
MQGVLWSLIMTPKARAHRAPDIGRRLAIAPEESVPASDLPIPAATDPDRLQRLPRPSDMRLLGLWQPAMPHRYRVNFFNTFARGRRTYKVCRRSILVPRACCAEEALDIAKARFAEYEGVTDWHIHAAGIEVVSTDDASGSAPAAAADPALS